MKELYLLMPFLSDSTCVCIYAGSSPLGCEWGMNVLNCHPDMVQSSTI